MTSQPSWLELAPTSRPRPTRYRKVVGENTPALVILLLASAFGMMAVREVNYAMFAMLVTMLVVYTQRILGADAAESGRDRLAETILGVAIASVVLGLTEALSRTRKQAA